jgi:hypothetical protein
LTDVDPVKNSTVTFSTLSAAQGETGPESLDGDTLQSNLIMPEPTHFLDQNLGPVAIIRPTSIAFGGAVASVQSFVTDGLFIKKATPGSSKSSCNWLKKPMGLAANSSLHRKQQLPGTS